MANQHGNQGQQGFNQRNQGEGPQQGRQQQVNPQGPGHTYQDPAKPQTWDKDRGNVGSQGVRGGKAQQGTRGRGQTENLGEAGEGQRKGQRKGPNPVGFNQEGAAGQRNRSRSAADEGKESETEYNQEEIEELERENPSGRNQRGIDEGRAEE